MEFRAHATTEATTLMGRLLATRSETTRRELERFREALNEAAQAAEAALAESSQAETDDEIAALVERLATMAAADTKAATARVAAESQTAVDAVRRELTEQKSRNEQLAASLKDARAQTETREKELKAEKAGTDAVRAELARAEKARQQAEDTIKEQAKAKSVLSRELQEVRGALENLRGEAASVSRQLETEAADRAKLAASFGAAQDQLHAAEAQRQTLVAQLATASSRAKAIEGTGAEHDRVRKDLETKLDAAVKAEKALRQQVSDGERAITKARSEAESSAQEVRRMAAELEQAEARAADGARSEPGPASPQSIKTALLPLDWLLAAFQKIATSDSMPGMLTTLVDALGNDFPRVMLFTVNGSRLEGQEQRGFSLKGDVSKVAIPLGTDSLLARAVTSCRIQGASAGELSDSSRKLLGGKPGFVLVMPVAVRRKTLAVIYADDSGSAQTEFATPERKAKFAQLLLWQAIPRLPKLLNEGKAPLAEAG